MTVELFCSVRFRVAREIFLWVSLILYDCHVLIVSGVLYSFLGEDHIIANGSECWQVPVFFYFKYTENKKNKTKEDGVKPRFYMRRQILLIYMWILICMHFAGGLVILTCFLRSAANKF